MCEVTCDCCYYFTKTAKARNGVRCAVRPTGRLESWTTGRPGARGTPGVRGVRARDRELYI